MTLALILVSVFLTSLLSGVIGMAGGLILMAVLVSLMPVTHAMVLHGVVQAVSNGARFWFLKEHMLYRILPGYILGSCVAICAFFLMSVIPNENFVLILLGLTPLVSHAIPKDVLSVDMRKPGTAFLCGCTVVGIQLIQGVSGPLLDVFYQKSPLNRFQIVATKAFTQTIGHVCKTLYYGYVSLNLSSPQIELNPIWTILAVILALAGTKIGTKILYNIREESFQRFVPWAIDVVGVLCIARGVVGVLQGGD
ncbi:MAG: sulfite exporter TauE/SafE family protein [Gammaproteobacteria bacterium]|nr:sulfite exporter TauE/SafE family protein [Gammaproteobacteria bacterium]